MHPLREARAPCLSENPSRICCSSSWEEAGKGLPHDGRALGEVGRIGRGSAESWERIRQALGDGGRGFGDGWGSVGTGLGEGWERVSIFGGPPFMIVVHSGGGGGCILILLPTATHV